MRILVVPGYLGFGGRRPSGSSGAGIFFRDQAIAMARAGHEVSLVYVHFDATSGTSIEVTDDEGVRCIFVHAAPWPKLNSLRRMALAARACRQVLAERPPEIVHAHVFLALPTAWAVARAFGVPYVVTEHSSKVRMGSVRLGWRPVARAGYAMAGAVLAVSDALADAMARYTSREVCVVPNLVRDEFFEVPLGIRSDGGFTFMSLGSCDPIKGWDLLIRAFAQLPQGGPTTLVLCGGACPDLVELAVQLGVRDRVRFTGRVEPGEVVSLLESCDCHVMPSRVETFGIATVEALACGKPVIMSATDAAASIVHSDNGLIVPVGDVGALARAMEFLRHEVHSFDSVAIREACRSRFSGRTITDRIASAYAAIDGSRR